MNENALLISQNRLLRQELREAHATINFQQRIIEKCLLTNQGPCRILVEKSTNTGKSDIDDNVEERVNLNLPNRNEIDAEFRESAERAPPTDHNSSMSTSRSNTSYRTTQQATQGKPTPRAQDNFYEQREQRQKRDQPESYDYEYENRGNRGRTQNKGRQYYHRHEEYDVQRPRYGHNNTYYEKRPEESNYRQEPTTSAPSTSLSNEERQAMMDDFMTAWSARLSTAKGGKS
jgi:hypothetical protein